MRALLVCLLAVGCGKSDDKAAAPARTEQATLAWVAEVPGVGYDNVRNEEAWVLASPHAVVVEGKTIVAITKGAIDASDLVDGKIPRLTTFMAAFEATMKAKGRAPFEYHLALDREHPVRLLVQMISSIDAANGVKGYTLVARKGTHYLQVPVRPSEQLAMAEMLEPIPTSPVSIDVKEKLVWRGHETSLTADAMLGKIMSAYAAGLRRCYERPVEVPSTDTLRFTIGVEPDGRVVSSSLQAATEAIRGCVGAQLTSWRFPIPKDIDGEPASTTATFELLVTTKPGATSDGTKATPVPVMEPDDQPLGMAIAITKTDVLVWSLSGREGTLRQPRHQFPLADAVERLPGAIADVVKRRWGGGAPRKRDDRDILVIADSSTTIGTLAPLLGAVRAAPDGTELFPRILLSTGFE